jgi:WD40 repeat protein
VLLWETAGGKPVRLDGAAGFGGAGVVAFSPDGRWLAATGSNGAAVWEVARRKRHAVYADDGPARLVAFSPDGMRLAIEGESGALHLWELGSGASKDVAHPGEAARDMRFSPDGRRLAFTRGINVRLLDLATGDVRKLRGHAFDVVRLAFSPDGARLATIDREQALRVWDVNEGLPQIGLLPGGARNAVVALSADGKRVAVARSDGAWLGAPATAGGRFLGGAEVELARLAWPDGPAPAALGEPRLALSADGAHLALAATAREGAHRHDVVLWETGSRRARWLAGHQGGVTVLAFSPDGKWLATGGEDRAVRLWALPGGEARVLSGHQGTVRDLAFAPDGATLASVGEDRALRLWDVGGGAPRGHTAPGELVRVAWSPDGALLATEGGRGEVALWTVAGERRELKGEAEPGGLSPSAFSTDGHLLAVPAAGARRVLVWSTQGGEARALKVDQPISQLDFLGRGTLVAIASRHGDLLVRDAAGSDSWSLLEKGPAVVALDATADGRMVASLDAEGQLRLWSTALAVGGEADLRAWIERATEAVIGAGQRLEAPAP